MPKGDSKGRREPRSASGPVPGVERRPRRRQSQARQSQPDVQEILAAISRTVDSSLRTQDTYQHVAEAIAALIPYDRLVVSKLDSMRAQLTREFIAGADIPGRRASSRPVHGSFAEIAFTEGKPVIADAGTLTRIAQSDSVTAEWTGHGFRSLLVCPLIASGEPIGAIALSAFAADAFRGEHATLLQQIGSYISSSLVNAVLHEQLIQEAEARGAVSRIGLAVNAAEGMEQLFETLVVELTQAIPVDRLTLVLADGANGTTTGVFEWGVPLPEPSQQQDGEPTSIVSMLLQSGQSLLAGDFTDEVVRKERPSLERLIAAGLNSGMSTPLVHRGRPVGVLFCASKYRNTYTAAHQALVEQVAAHVSSAVTQYSLRISAEREARELAAIAEIGRAVSAASDIGEAFTTLMASAQLIIPCDRVVVTGYDEEMDEWEDLYFAGMSLADYYPGKRVPVADTIAPSVLKGGQTLVLNENELIKAAEIYLAQRRGLEAGLRSMMVVPLVWQNQLVGTLNFRSKRPDAYGSREKAAAERVCAQIAGAIYTARIFKKLQREVEIRQSLASIGLAVGKDLEIEKVYDRTAEGLSTLLSFDRLSITLYDNATGKLHLRYFQGVEMESRPLGAEVPMTSEKMGWRLMFQRSAAEGIHFGSEFHLAPFKGVSGEATGSTAADLQSRIEVPLGAEAGGAIGYLGLSSLKSNAYALQDLDLLQRVATQITPAFQNAIAHRQALELSDQKTRTIVLEAQTRELQRMNEAKSQFLSTVTHELKTPLTSIMAFTDILSRSKSDPPTGRQPQHIEVIRRNAVHLNSLINDLLDVSTMEAGRISLLEQKGDLSLLLRHAADSLRPQFDAKKQTLKLELPQDHVEIVADFERINQVVSNLLTNASKFSNEGTETVIRLTASDSWCEFSVRDSGIGISREQQVHLFAPFYRSDNSATRLEGGAGLGLALSKHIVDLHGGQIEVKSSAGQGSTFTVRLPRHLELVAAS
jgi:signal transduction histidine kinase/putative methionine-R-sulfoxide reductase with GAF domain